jgi:hypothetical protein
VAQHERRSCALELDPDGALVNEAAAVARVAFAHEQVAGRKGANDEERIDDEAMLRVECA